MYCMNTVSISRILYYTMNENEQDSVSGSKCFTRYSKLLLTSNSPPLSILVKHPPNLDNHIILYKPLAAHICILILLSKSFQTREHLVICSYTRPNPTIFSYYALMNLVFFYKGIWCSGKVFYFCVLGCWCQGCAFDSPCG